MSKAAFKGILGTVVVAGGLALAALAPRAAQAENIVDA